MNDPLKVEKELSSESLVRFELIFSYLLPAFLASVHSQFVVYVILMNAVLYKLEAVRWRDPNYNYAKPTVFVFSNMISAKLYIVFSYLGYNTTSGQFLISSSGLLAVSLYQINFMKYNRNYFSIAIDNLIGLSISLGLCLIASSLYNYSYDLTFTLFEFFCYVIARHALVIIIGLYGIGEINRVLQTLKEDFLKITRELKFIVSINSAKHWMRLGCICVSAYVYLLLYDPPFYTHELIAIYGSLLIPTITYNSKTFEFYEKSYWLDRKTIFAYYISIKCFLFVGRTVSEWN